MRFVLYTNTVSAHQLPLARAIARRIGEDNFRYVYTDASTGGNQEVQADDPWITQDVTLCETCDILLCGGLRPIDLFERRVRNGLITFYQTERWFKPIPFLGILLPGWLRLLSPSYFRMARRFIKLLNDYKCFKCLAIGSWAFSDMRKIGVRKTNLFEWGYFVEPSSVQRDAPPNQKSVLYIGRLIGLKRVDTIIAAVKNLPCRLTIYGDGPEMSRLRTMASDNPNISIHGAVSLAEVRSIMRENDIFVFASNAMEGWGAVVNEALEEGMIVVGTHESGACATLLPVTHRFSSGNVKELQNLLLKIVNGELTTSGLGCWRPDDAVEKMFGIINNS